MVDLRRLRAALVLLLIASVAGCAAVVSSAHSPSARQILEGVVRSIAGDRHPDIDGFARSAVSAIEEDAAARDVVSLVGIDEREPTKPGAPFGALTFRVQLAAGSYGLTADESFEACYEVEFDQYGVVDKRVWEGVDYLREQGCPVGATPVVPPMDTSIKYVVAANAEEAATRVLSEVTSDANLDSNDITAKILALLDVPDGKYEQLAPPTVVVVDGNVGVAMGYRARECVLVARVDDVVSRVRPAPIKLEPGELGCRPETALMDPAQLAPPH